MLSFLKHRPEDDEDETSEGESSHPKEKQPMRFMSLQDALFLLVLAGLIFGVYYYFKDSKDSSNELFETCEAFYVAKDWVEMENCYEETWELGYVTDALDSIRQIRLGIVKDLRAAQEDILEKTLDFWEKGALYEAVHEFYKMKQPLLLIGEREKEWNEFNEKFRNAEGQLKEQLEKVKEDFPELFSKTADSLSVSSKTSP